MENWFLKIGTADPMLLLRVGTAPTPHWMFLRSRYPPSPHTNFPCNPAYRQFGFILDYEVGGHLEKLPNMLIILLPGQTFGHFIVRLSQMGYP